MTQEERRHIHRWRQEAHFDVFFHRFHLLLSSSQPTWTVFPDRFPSRRAGSARRDTPTLPSVRQWYIFTPPFTTCRARVASAADVAREAIDAVVFPHQRMIDERPKEAETRRTLGHWEGDLVAGAAGSGHLVTLVELRTRFTLAGRVPSGRADEVGDEILRQLERLPVRTSRTLTLDNGKEFARHERIAREAGLGVFLANPYHAWERGTNEQTNGLIRRLHPKGSSLGGIDEQALCRIERFLNDRPRKCLGWRTPREALQLELTSRN